MRRESWVAMAKLEMEDAEQMDVLQLRRKGAAQSWAGSPTTALERRPSTVDTSVPHINCRNWERGGAASEDQIRQEPPVAS